MRVLVAEAANQQSSEAAAAPADCERSILSLSRKSKILVVYLHRTGERLWVLLVLLGVAAESRTTLKQHHAGALLRNVLRSRGALRCQHAARILHNVDCDRWHAFFADLNFLAVLPYEPSRFFVSF